MANDGKRDRPAMPAVSAASALTNSHDSARARELAILLQVTNGPAHEDFIVRAQGGALDLAREVEMGIRETGVERERVLVRGDRFGGAALVLEHDAQVEPEQRDALVGAQGQAVVGLGRGEVVPVVVEAAEVIVRVGQVWAAGNGALVGVRGTGPVTCLLGGAATLVPLDRAGALAHAAPGSDFEHHEIAHARTVASRSDT